MEQSGKRDSFAKSGTFVSQNHLDLLRNASGASSKDLLALNASLKDGDLQRKKGTLNAPLAGKANIAQAIEDEAKKQGVVEVTDSIDKEIKSLLPIFKARTEQVILSRSQPGINQQTRSRA